MPILQPNGTAVFLHHLLQPFHQFRGSMFQKYFLLVGIPRQLIHRPFRNEQPFKNDAHPVANLLYLFQQVGTQEYGHPPALSGFR